MTIKVVFYSTSGYHPGHDSDTYVETGANAYPYPSGLGYDVGFTSLSSLLFRNNSTSVDHRLGGDVRTPAWTVTNYQISLPSTGDYDIALALGTENSSPNAVHAKMFDNTTQFGSTIGLDASVGGGEFYDATGVLRTPAATWVSSNATVTRTFASTLFRLEFQGGGNTKLAAHIGIYPAGGSTQNLTPSLFTDSDSFYAPTVTTGAVALSPALFSDSDTFYSATVSVGAVTLQPSLFADADTFYSATVTQDGAPQTLTPSLFVDDDTFYAVTVSAGSVTLTPSLFTDADSFYAATVSAIYDITPALFTDADTFHSPTVSVGAVNLSASLFADADTFYTHTIGSGGAPQDLTPALFTDSDTFYAATLTTGAVTLTPALFIDADAFYSATIANGSVILEPPIVDDADIFYAPDVSTSNALAVDLFADSDAFYSPAVLVGAVTLSASLFIDGDTFYSHALTGGESGNTPVMRIFSIPRENRVYSVQ